MSTALQLQQRAVEETGGSVQNAIFEFGPVFETTGGVLTAEFNGFITEPLDYPFSAADLKDALELLGTIGTGGVNVSGPIGGPWEVELIGGNAGQVVPLILVDGSSLEPPQEIQVELIQQGATTNYGAAAAQLWADNAGAANDLIRFLQVKIALIDLRLGSMTDLADIRTGQVNIVEEKSSQRVLNLERMRERAETALAKAEGSASSGRRRTHGRIMRHKTPNGLPYGQMGIDRSTGRLR